MDAASRAELDRLRVRAYGPDGDIWSDATAVRRLIELEAEALEGRGERRAEASAREAEPPAPPAARTAPAARVAPAVRTAPAPRAAQSAAPAARPGPAPTATPTATPAPRAAPAPVPLSRRAAITLAGIGGALILAIGGFALVRALIPPDPPVTASTDLAPAVRDARAAYSFAWDREAVPLLHIPLDGSFGRYIDLPSATEVPEFPANGTVEWAYPLGEYFGWEVWIAGASVDATGLGREHCILVERNDDVRGRCVPAHLRAQSALLVSVPFASVAAEDRPVGMARDERLGFWWNHDRAVTVLVGEDPDR